jgi:phage protein D/phage baseplate assembly protein gpV
MPTQASQSSDLHVAGAEVLIAGSPASPEMRALIVEVRVQDTVSLPSSAIVRFSDPEMTLIDDSKLAIGKEIEVKFSELAGRSMTSVFKGEIVALEPNFSETGLEMLVRAYDKSHRLQRGRAVKTYQQVTATDIVKQLCSEAGIPGDVESTTPQYEFFMRKGETPREVIARFEREYNYRFWLADGKYNFKKAAVSGAAIPLKLRENLIAFRPRASAAEVSTEVAVRGWDPKKKAAIVGTGTPTQTAATTGGFTPNTARSAFSEAKVFTGSRVVDTAGEANDLAKALAGRKADTVVEAEGTTFGNPKIRAATKVKIENVGTRFAGEYVVSSVSHTYSSKTGYKTHFRISGAATRGLLDLMRPPERRDWSQNLVVGVVTNNNDPESTGRVRVKFPSLSDQEESAWARIASVSAGDARGLMMLPQVNEEVIVGFENGDPRRPIVVGSLFNGKDKPGDDLIQNKDGSFALLSNEQALMHTKKDMTFKSDKKMVIEVTEDQSVKAKSIASETQQGAKLKSGTTYEIEAGSSMTIKGVSVTVEASASLTLKGATVDVQASGPLTLKGAIINIG